MTLIKSISGFRGTIGGTPNDNLTPVDIVKFASAYGEWIRSAGHGKLIVIGRDARLSGGMVSDLVTATLQGMGLDILDLGLSTTPTVEMAVMMEKAAGGIILTASHNPKQWNALKLLNHKGEFISAEEAKIVLSMAEAQKFEYADINNLGKYEENKSYIQKHIDAILKLPLVDVKAITEKQFKIVVDAVNSSGGIAVPMLLKALGVAEIIELNCEPTGHFAHNPEPLPEHLTELASTVKSKKAHLGICVDPDVDRLALVGEDGAMFGEEYTLVAVADYVLKHHKKGNTVSNLSSTRALKDITEKAGGKYSASAVGEVNVVAMMKETKAVIGGEGNGGIIYPELHYGRDALVGIALFLSSLSKSGKSCTALRMTFPNYIISKNKVDLTIDINPDEVLEKIKDKYKKFPINTVDGVRIDFDEEWIHLRKSNTEPIIRIYAESKSETTARNLTMKIIKDIGEIANR
ncbi:MAG: phosphoglucosamine mutase [Bacteroidia bacterium]|nr:phosphoglucosamine mutase [Bacteroidia bacterium]